MKKTVLTLALALAAAFISFAQQNVQDAAAEAAKAIAEAPQELSQAPKPSNWTDVLVLDFGFNQTELTNWAAGGFNNLNLNAGLDAKADYAKDLASWGNRLQLQYGILWSEDKEDLIQRSTDRIYLESKFSYRTSKDSKWSYSVDFDFRSQFSNGYTYNKPAEGQTWTEAATLKSGFLSPAYTNLGLGMYWAPNALFNINLSPFTGGLTFVRIPDLRYTYGMDLLSKYAEVEEKAADTPGSHFRYTKFQLGALIKTNVKFNINDKFGYETQLVLFSDYLNRPWVPRVNWDNKITWQIAKYFKLGLNTWLIYDPNVMITDNSGNTATRVQIKEFLTFSFTWKTGNK